MIPYGRQNINDDDIAAVVETLKSNYLTQGPKVPAFEQALCHYTNANYAFATNSATSALHIACMALGVSDGDIVWTSPISFVASANCALYCGASIDFIDIDLNTGNISIEHLAEMLILAEQNNTLPKVIIPVHLAGQSCDMKAIAQLCEPYNIHIIEDASHAIGGEYNGNKIGACQYSDISIFSFHPVKIITSAEGGMALTNNTCLAEKLDRLRSHGITRDINQMKGLTDGPWYYQQVELGYNYRMTELQAALGLSQLKNLDNFVALRNEKAAVYLEKLKKLPLNMLEVSNNSLCAYHLFIIQLQDTQKHKKVFEALRKSGIGVNLHYIPIPSQPYYQSLGYTFSEIPMAEKYYQGAISLPLFPDLTVDEQKYIIETLGTILK
ncbi:UDP-4-amino-4,6-dideoxy-N-acetyl-beta-L-altrosamine transaminase [Pseudoalteromonas denitrificans]|uniref:UDP-4-amino-4,6-dideoxy-N-acetyl-beta-L-altrosamine transaminase n=1 Tax=Pseudoalteromonas denitrificans DSM 6059 TaxID=1123010 RepID=A0A1I1HJ10_9GAMM|nr:UDP-4-amino-4,6-dideoxy-N-acetyl-beta-L-altrosamine transaminase [Pseudoalteromonas denitrificans]SFC23964.1 UDP-4-amino-4,6-dideoxy-N-acetyl-beta-L-altrosamine transaminase [Pseudoalteromonas denitrificans DSM 6059]